MSGKSYLAYINANAYIFNYTDFNFDSKYIFELEVNKEGRKPQYILHVSKRSGIIQPEGFWGNNISSVNALIGQNGSGKTSFFRLIANHIGTGLTALNGEFIIYIVYCDGIYIVYESCAVFPISIVKSDDAADINIYMENDYFEFLRSQGNFKPPFDNRRFWKNVIFFSNHFGTLSMRNSNYFINVSKDEEINDAINQLNSIEELKTETLANIYKRYRDLKIFKYSRDMDFQLMASKCKVSLPNLVRFVLLNNEDYNEYMDTEKFPYKKWLGKNRYDIYTHDGNIYEYEAAINKFSVYLMIYLKEESLINERIFQSFLADLAGTSSKTGPEIALEYLTAVTEEPFITWAELLNYINDKSNDEDKKFILNWQSDGEFCCRWDEKDIVIIEKILAMDKSKLFFACGLVGSETNGFYSSGEESKLSVSLSMYEALRRVKSNKNGVSPDNIIILLDEIDAFFHPKYQINVVSELLEIISKGFEGYNVQIILASNTPLELSDFPSSNIIYLENGQVAKNQNHVVTFGSNVCSLMKDQFYINTTMGAFAKSKIDAVIKYLSDADDTNIGKNEAAYIISIIGEPVIKKKLQEMYYEKFPLDNTESEEKIEYYKGIIRELQETVRSKERIDDGIVNSLEEVLQKLSNIVKSVRE